MSLKFSIEIEESLRMHQGFLGGYKSISQHFKAVRKASGGFLKSQELPEVEVLGRIHKGFEQFLSSSEGFRLFHEL